MIRSGGEVKYKGTEETFSLVACDTTRPLEISSDHIRLQPLDWAHSHNYIADMYAQNSPLS